MKKTLRAVFSMRTALILLGILVIACVAGSVIPQGEEAAWYMSAYSRQAAGAILALGLDDVFHCPWFIALAVFLCLNLLGCNLVRFPQLFRQFKEGFTPERFLKAHGKGEPLTACVDPEALFAACGFRNVHKTVVQAADGAQTDTPCIYAVKNRAGIWGAWVCHLGMLIVILGFGLGQMLQVQYAVYGVPGQTKQVGDTDYTLTIDDFTVELREDDTVEQYTAAVTMTDTRTGETQSGETSVNPPATLFGMRCYQNSTGWAADIQVYKDEELIQEKVLCAGETMDIEDAEGLSLAFSAFYPDYEQGPDGMPRTASGKLNNPGYLYRLFYQGEMLGMNVLMEKEAITVDAYTIIFTDPQSYTLIQIKRDPFTWLAGIGAALVMAGLFLAFYLRTAELCALRGADGSWQVMGYSRKGGEEFAGMVREKREELEAEKTSHGKEKGEAGDEQ